MTLGGGSLAKSDIRGGQMPKVTKNDIRGVKHLYRRRNDGIRNAERFAIASLF